MKSPTFQANNLLNFILEIIGPEAVNYLLKVNSLVNSEFQLSKLLS